VKTSAQNQAGEHDTTYEMQEVKDRFSRSQHASDLRKCGAKGIRTPDLLHAIQARTIARQSQASPGVAAASGNCGWTSPSIGRRLATSAPNLAPSKVVSRANVRAGEGRLSGARRLGGFRSSLPRITWSVIIS
jgi:hypothetical protein